MKNIVAIESLQYITQSDPLYRPAGFFLAYAVLQEGDAKKAAELFHQILESIDKEAQFTLDMVRQDWRLNGVRFSWIIKRFKPLRTILKPYIENWIDITHKSIGGVLYYQAKHWNYFKVNYLDKKSKNQGLIKFEKDLYLQNMDIFTEKYGIRKYVKIASGALQDDEVSQEEARRTLDFILDPHKFAMFDINLLRMEHWFLIKNVMKNYEEIDELIGDTREREEHEDISPLIRELQESDIGDVFFKKALKLLEQHRNEQNWDAFKNLIKWLREQTRRPSKYEAIQTLKNVSKLPRNKGWLVRFFLPSFGLIDKWRTKVRNAFYLESEFYCALAHYRTFTRDGYQEAIRLLADLYESHLVDLSRQQMTLDRQANLKFLARCIEVNALLRNQIDPQPDPEHTKTIYSIDLSFEENEITEFEKIIKNKKKDPELRASALNTLGLFYRYRNLTRPKSFVDDTESELQYFYDSLDLHRLPDTCFYIAETLYRRGQKNEARAYLVEAVSICPLHIGAMTLMRAIDENLNVNISNMEDDLEALLEDY